MSAVYSSSSIDAALARRFGTDAPLNPADAGAAQISADAQALTNVRNPTTNLFDVPVTRSRAIFDGVNAPEGTSTIFLNDLPRINVTLSFIPQNNKGRNLTWSLVANAPIFIKRSLMADISRAKRMVEQSH